MVNGHAHLRNPWAVFHGPNLGYIFEQYEKFLNDELVDSDLKEKFLSWGAPVFPEEKLETPSQQSTVDTSNIEQIIKIINLLDSIRSQGHLVAKINPLEDEVKVAPFSHLKQFNLTEGDLKSIPAKTVLRDCPEDVQTAWDAMERLKETYTGVITFEFEHVEERAWLYKLVESTPFHHSLGKEEKIKLLQNLTEVEKFEQFLHRTFVGQKRFSIEGLDSLVPVLNEFIRYSANDDTNNVLIGMAHRGRLSVLAHVLKKAYRYIFAEFQHLHVDGEKQQGWAGDVKYHLGWEQAYSENTRITLANNPSHLEFVNPVIEGFTRAAQDSRHTEGYPTQDISKALAILVHGDAAFPGQGIVAETLNLANIPGYSTGGTIHIIANNLIGFTTDSSDSRSTKYASDLAKGFGIPIIHVNADEPEACIAAARIAYKYRTQFQKDILIDLVGYRRFGHNEMDDPAVTQPHIYKKVSKHPTVRAIYAKHLQQEGTMTEAEIEQLNQKVLNELRAEYEKIFQQNEHKRENTCPEVIKNGIPAINTSVSFHTLQKINTELLTWQDGFHVYPKLQRILERRKDSFKADGKIEWALAEELAFATILQDGTPIRLTGQDSQRGTFAHRHIVLHDTETNQLVSPLHAISNAHASFTVHNSPLSEAAVVGFEYGYNVFAPETLVLWEAQYGDFSNTAQTFFDQFIAAGRAKWNQKSGLILLLPHGYEGQGAEHSSARPERFLQLSAENNWTVANVTTAAQYFHLLRRQAAILGTEYVRPLVLMTPKSLLRQSLTSSSAKELAEGAFQTILEQATLGKKTEEVKRIIFTTGKIAIDLATELEKKDQKDLDKLHIIRVEQLYPFPKERIEAILTKYKQAEEIVWVQEEPKNMGAWQYISPNLSSLLSNNQTLEFIGREEQSSPAVGDPQVHKLQQEQIIKQALTINSLLYS